MPAGPLAVRWLSYELPPYRAGAAAVGRVELENAGTAPWRSRPGTGIHLSYHWLDSLGNAIVWAGHFILLPERVAPGERFDVFVTVRAPMPPGRYRLAFDLVEEGRFWFTEVGNTRLELDVDVAPRLVRRALAVRVEGGSEATLAESRAALEAQEEPVADDGEATAWLVAGARPWPDWSRRILDAHEEGFAVVAGSIDVTGGPLARRSLRELAAWRPGFGRSPAWSLPLLCPSVLGDVDVVANASVLGLPGVEPAELEEPWVCDGRIGLVVPATALRRDGRPRG